MRKRERKRERVVATFLEGVRKKEREYQRWCARKSVRVRCRTERASVEHVEIASRSERKRRYGRRRNIVSERDRKV